MEREIVPPKDFKGLLWAPSNEQEVVLLFGLLLPYLDEPISIDECREAYPDCIAIRSHDGRRIRIEFELLSGNFQQHGHDPSKCEMIVCWKHNWPGRPESIEVLELSQVIKDKNLHFILEPNQTKYLQTDWTEESFFEVAGSSPSGYVHEIYEFCRSQSGLSIIFGHGDKLPSFTVRATSVGAPSTPILGVYANGKIWPGFPGTFPEYIIDGYRARLSRIERISPSAKSKEWFEFMLDNERELEIIIDTLKWLATIDWRSSR